MRLVNVTTGLLEEFTGSTIPPYAAVSHRWGNDEVLFQDFEKRRPIIEPPYGWTKILQAGRIAQERGLQYVWLDTCCIDKNSSAELSEAINSMFSWYQNAQECYAFLVDVPSLPSIPTSEEAQGALTGIQPFEPDRFRCSVWFTRAWTLQELLAPSSVIFFSSTFDELGSKADLCGLISEVTRIPPIFVTSNDMIRKASVAERMKWASMREATRLEDVAYSLMGLFDVNMPLLYGEGNKAFFRLQTEIIKNSDDESIFGWSGRAYDQGNGLLGPSPSVFSRCNDVRRHHVVPRQHYEVTNKGIRMNLLLREQQLENSFAKSSEVRVLLLLNCTDFTFPASPDGERSPLGIQVHLRRDTRGIHLNSKLKQMVPVIGDRVSLRTIQSVKHVQEMANENGDTYYVIRGNDGTMSFCDTMSPTYAEDALNVPVYFSTGW